MYRGAELAPNYTMDTENVALLAAGTLTKFEIVHFTASSEPSEPEGSAVVKDIMSCAATESNVTELAGTLADKPTVQSAACSGCCKDAANIKPNTVMDVMG